MKFYLSHSIRGAKKDKATPLDMKKNCDRVILVANYIRRIVPEAELYVPAEHEDFVGIAFHDKYLNEHQVLEIDCKIIDRCDGVIIFCPPNDPICGGRTIEYEHAIATSKPVLIFDHAIQATHWLAHKILEG